MYPAEVSCTTAEHLLDLLLTHSVKVVRHRDLSGHETEPPDLSAGWSAKGGDLYYRFASLGNDERFALGCLFYKFRELSFRFVNIYCFHNKFFRLSSIDLVYQGTVRANKIATTAAPLQRSFGSASGICKCGTKCHVAAFVTVLQIMCHV